MTTLAIHTFTYNNHADIAGIFGPNIETYTYFVEGRDFTEAEQIAEGSLAYRTVGVQDNPWRRSVLNRSTIKIV